MISLRWALKFGTSSTFHYAIVPESYPTRSSLAKSWLAKQPIPAPRCMMLGISSSRRTRHPHVQAVLCCQKNLNEKATCLTTVGTVGALHSRTISCPVSTVIWSGWYEVKPLKRLKTSRRLPHISSTCSSSRFCLFQVQRSLLFSLFAFNNVRSLLDYCSTKVSSRKGIIFSTKQLSSSLPVNSQFFGSIKQAFASAHVPMQGSSICL